MKILNFGSLNIDYVYNMDHFVVCGETQAAGGMNLFPGGKGLNQSVALARAGVRHFFAGCIGEGGAFLKSLLDDCGVNTDMIKTSGGANGHAVIQVTESGENCIIVFHGSNYEISKEYIDTVLSNFGRGDYLILQNEISEVEYIIDSAFSKGIKIILNPSPFDETMKRIDLDKIAYLILNEIEAAGYVGFDSVGEFIRRFRDMHPKLKTVITLGKSGCVYFDRDVIIKQSTFAVDVVDTTGAGDTFTGYFAAGVAAGADMPDILKTACASSAIAVTRMGAAAAIPEMCEVEKFLSERL